MTSRQSPRIVVVGGGALGLASAARLVGSGADVTLVTEGALASGASGRSLSWLNSAGRRPVAYHQLRMAGIDRYRTLAAAHPDADWLRFEGGLRWRPPTETDQLRLDHEHERAVGYDSTLLSPYDVHRRFPAVAAEAVPETGALLNAGEGWVELPALVALLAEQVVAGGGTVVTGAGPVQLVTQGSAVVGVRAGNGERLDADAVLLATGADVPRALAELGVSVPEATPLALLVRTEPASTGLRQVLNTPRVAVRPAPGGTLSVDADWPTARIEAAGPEAESNGGRVPDAVVEELLAEASAVLASRPQLRPANVWIGAKPVPGDGDPVLGPVPGVERLHVAFTHSGATLALVAGELLADQLLTGHQAPLLAPFGVARFLG